jgi:4-hydroxymandelate oxidase
MLPLRGVPLTSNLQSSQQVSEDVANALNVWDFRAIAEKRLPYSTWQSIIGAAADEITLRWNRESFDRIRLRPDILVDHRGLDTGTSLFGQEMPLPIMLCPTGGHRNCHPDAEVATARGAGMGGATMVISSNATRTVEDIAAAATHPLWFQAYVLRDRSFLRDQVQRVEDAGCQAICVTLDSPIQGPRNRRDRAAQIGVPSSGGFGRANLQGMKTAQELEHPRLNSFKDPSATYKDIGWLCSIARVPVLLKGVLDAQNAERGLQEGIGGVIVSNHGGRNLDTAPATIDALPDIVERVGDQVPVLMDGGVRRGTDVLKALALGAKAVLIGRAYLYGLAADGPEGVRRVLEILQTELEMAMVLTGRPTIASIDRSVLWSPPA